LQEYIKLPGTVRVFLPKGFKCASKLIKQITLGQESLKHNVVADTDIQIMCAYTSYIDLDLKAPSTQRYYVTVNNISTRTQSDHHSSISVDPNLITVGGNGRVVPIAPGQFRLTETVQNTHLCPYMDYWYSQGSAFSKVYIESPYITYQDLNF
jgi:hypothetical protein